MAATSIAYRIAVGSQQDRKVFSLQTLRACEEPFGDGGDKVAEIDDKLREGSGLTLFAPPIPVFYNWGFIFLQRNVR